MNLLTLLFFSSFCLAGVDHYKNFAELSSSEKENIDYQIVVNNRHSQKSIFAIHGGKIEWGTSELTKAIAQNKNNTYLFEGLKDGDNFGLHLTSSNFDEPRAVELALGSVDCLSIHGFIGSGVAVACVGGGNEEKAEAIAKALAKSGLPFTVEYPCKAYPGRHSLNIINRCQNKGVQVELSQKLRDDILNDPAYLDSLAQALRDSF